MSEMYVEEIRRFLPHRYPFLLVDRVLACVPGESLQAIKNISVNEPQFTGHFPEVPIMPGVLIIEAMAQTGVVAYGIYLASKQMTRDEIKRTLTVFTEADVEFTGLVRPGDRVVIRAKQIYFRRLKLKVEAEITLENGDVVCSGTIAGMGVRQV